MAERTEQGEKRAERWRWMLVIVVSMAIFLDTVDVSIVNVALPDLQRGLHLTTADLQWVPGIYGLTNAGFLLLGGRAADLLGRRRIFLLGATLFGLASFTGGLANSGWLLILARGVQGVGAALTMPAATSIITTTFAEGPERNQALGIFSATGGAGFTCGLVIGGLLTSFIGWHWVFLVNVPFVLLILLLARNVVPQDRSPIERERSYDLAGAILVTGGLLLLVYALTQAGESGATPLKTGTLLILAIFLLILFVLVEQRSRTPLMPLHIFRSRNLSVVCVVSFTLLASFFSFLFVFTLYLQNVLHYSPIQASLAQLPTSILSIVTSQFVSPRLMNRFGVRLTISLGMLCLLCGALLFFMGGAANNYLGIILPTLLAFSFGMALCVPALGVATVIGIEQTEQGLAAGLQGTWAQGGGGLGVAMTAAVVSASTVPSAAIVQQLYGLHLGLIVVAVCAAIGMMLAFIGIQK
ncbi:MFS transporter [Reticulibacter mediterranei]|nr:MFS transporter [Reticulibacter mediterranei]